MGARALAGAALLATLGWITPHAAAQETTGAAEATGSVESTAPASAAGQPEGSAASTPAATAIAPTPPRNPLSGLPGGLAALRNYRSMRVSSEDRAGNADMRRIEPGKSLVLAELEGPGEITHIWTTIATDDPDHLRNIVFRIYWDGNDYPSVEAPIGDFYGLGHGKYYYFHNPVQAIGTINGMNAFWPMPFAKSARLEVVNEGPTRTNAFYYYVDWRKFDTLPEGLGYFHAQYRQAHPAPDEQNYLILNTEGAVGHFVGVSLNIHTQVAGWWGEGDDIFTIDGEETPSIWGTGSEDYFCGAWCYGDTFYNDYFGMPLRTKTNQGSNNFWNVYRHHLESPITFTKSLKLEIEHGTHGFDNTRAGKNNNYSSVAYWYAARPLKLDNTLPPAAERLPTFSQPNQQAGLYEPQYMEAKAPQGANLEHQEMSGFTKEGREWKNRDQFFVRETIPGAVTELTFETTAPLKGNLLLGLTKAKDYGKIRLALDDQVILGEFNGYAADIIPVELQAGAIDLKPGKHTLRVTTLEKDRRSSNNHWGIDYLRVDPKAEE